MAAPEFVPTAAVPAAKAYSSPPQRDGGWKADRPGEVVGAEGQPVGPALGSHGPDQGYVWKIARRFEGKLHLEDGEHEADALAGCCSVALRRASLFSRAPVVHDLQLALALFGFTDTKPAADLIEWRRERFAELSHTTQHYFEGRALVGLVPEATLRMTPQQVAALPWRERLGL